MLGLFLALTRSFLSRVDVYDSCEQILPNEYVICVEAKDIKTFKFPTVFSDTFIVKINTIEVTTIDFSSLTTQEVKTLIVSGLNHGHQLVIDIKALPTTLEELHLSTCIVSFKEPATINYKLDGDALIKPAEAQKITQGWDFAIGTNYKKAFGISDVVGYEKAFVTDNCAEYLAFYNYKCIFKDKLELENFDDYVESKVIIYILNDVSKDHPIRFGASNVPRDIEFIGLNKTQGQGKYKITLDIENWNNGANVSSLLFRNLDLSFTEGSKKMPISDIKMYNMHFEPEVCKRTIFDENTLNTLYKNTSLASGDVYKCFGLKDKIGLTGISNIYIIDNCEDFSYNPKDTSCYSPEEYSNDLVCKSGKKNYNFYLEKDFDKIMNFTVCDWGAFNEMHLNNFNDADHPSFIIDLDNIPSAELFCTGITLKLYTKKEGDREFPFTNLVLKDTFCEYYFPTEIQIHYTVPGWYTFNRASNYGFFFFPTPQINIQFTNLIITDNESDSRCDLYDNKCIKPNQVGSEDFKKIEPSAQYLNISVESSTNEVLDFRKMSYAYSIITIIGNNELNPPTLSINFDNSNCQSLTVKNVLLNFVTDKTDRVTYSMDLKFSPNVIISGQKEKFFVTDSNKITSTKKAHYDFFSADFVHKYVNIDVRETCGDETKDDIHVKCVTPVEFNNYSFWSFKYDIGISLFAPINDFLLDFASGAASVSIAVKPFLPNTNKQSLILILYNYGDNYNHKDQSFTFTNLDLSFKTGAHRDNMKFPSYKLTLIDCTINQDQCIAVILEKKEYLISNTRRHYECFNITLPNYDGITIGSNENGYLQLKESELPSYDFFDFQDAPEITITNNGILSERQTFRFNKLDSAKSIILIGSNKNKFWLDVPNMGEYVNSISFDSVNLCFSVYGGVNTIKSKEFVLFNSEVTNDACSQVSFSDDTLLVASPRQAYECFNVEYPRLFVEDTCSKKSSKLGICVEKAEVANYNFRNVMFQVLTNISVALRTNLDSASIFNFEPIKNVTTDLEIESETKRDFTFNISSYGGKLALKNLNLKFSSTGSNALSLSSLHLTGCSIAKDQCKAITVPSELKQEIYADSAEIYECLGFTTKAIFIISSSCQSSYDEGTFCEIPKNIDSNTYSKFSKIVSLEIQLETSVLETNPLKFDFSQFKFSVSIKPKPTKMNEVYKVYLDADSMKDRLDNLELEKVELNFVTTNPSQKVDFDFPVSMKEVTIDPSSCDKVSISGKLNAEDNNCFVPTDNSEVPSDKPSFGLGPIIGVAAAAVVIVVVVIVVIVCVVKKKKDRETSSNDANIPADFQL